MKGVKTETISTANHGEFKRAVEVRSGPLFVTEIFMHKVIMIDYLIDVFLFSFYKNKVPENESMLKLILKRSLLMLLWRTTGMFFS